MKSDTASGRAPSIGNREQMERIRKNLLILRNQPDIYNRCLSLLEQGDNLFLDPSSDSNEKKAGIFLIVCQVELNNAEESTQVAKFARNLLKILTCSDEGVMRLASRAIAYLIQTSKTYAVELMELTLNQCSEWLEETQRNEERLLAAVILARDLALFTSSHFFQRATHYFNNIFKVIHDSKLHLRMAAIQSLHSALAVTSQRETKHKNEWYKRCFEEACIRSTREDGIHASLLIFNELLRIANAKMEKMRLKVLDVSANSCARTVIGLNPIEWLIAAAHPPAVESRTARALVTEHYFAEIVNRCMELRSTKSVPCQLVLLEIFPRLSSLSDVVQHELLAVPFQEMLTHVIQMASRPNAIQFPQALLTIGLLAVDRPTEVHQKALQSILQIIVQTLQQAKKKPIDVSVFKCLTLLVRSQRSKLSDNIRDMFPLLFSTGLSKGLTEVLKGVVEAIPELKTDALDGLLEQLYQLLMSRARPSKLAPPTPPPIPSGPIQPSNIELTKLALRTLGEFDFQRHALQMFIQYIAQGYLVCDSVEIRLTSVYCCAEIVKPFVRVHGLVENEQKLEVHTLIKNVLECLVRTAVVDSEVEVRLSVLKCFCAMDRDFLYHLAQRDMLDHLFKALYDESYQMQEQAVMLLGQLSELNPAMVFPKLRRIVLEVISQLINSHVPRIEEHSAKTIAKLSVQAPKFMSPYMNSLLLALLPHLQLERRSHVGVTIHVMNALSELSLIGSLEIVRCLDKVFPSLIAYLQDSTSLNRREAALRAMGAICQSSGYVIDPYKDYPDLLDILLKLLRTELSPSMRRLTMKVIGIIGALDPYTHKVYLGTVYSHKSKSLALTLPNAKEADDPKSDVSDIIQWVNYERCTLQEYYPALVIASLIEILQGEALVKYHCDIVHALFQIFSSLGPKSAQYVNQVIPRLVKITETCKPELREFFLGQFAKFAGTVKAQLKPHMKQILGLIAKAWNWNNSSDFRCVVINVLEAIGRAFGQEFAPFATDLCPYLLDIVQNDRIKDRRLTCCALSCVRSIVPCVSAHIHLILPPILYVLDDRQAHERVRLDALDTLIVLARNQSIAERAPPIMQTWLRCVAVRALQERLMQLLILVVSQMWEQFLVYRDSVNAALVRHKVDNVLRQEYMEQITQIQSSSNVSPMGFAAGRVVPRLRNDTLNFPGRVVDVAMLDRSSAMRARETRHLINIDQLRRFWTAQSLSTRDDWLQWLSALRTQFIRQSPSASIRACATLADVYEPLAKQLFNAAFMSVWTDIRESEQDELTNQLVDVLTLCPHAEPVQAILNLAEFMDHSEKGPLPVNYKMLSKCAEQTRAYAKALRYKELEIISSRNGEPNAEDCQALIIYANKLNLEEYSAGVVQYAEKMGMEISGRWYEKLGEWEKALDMYRMESHAERGDRTRFSQRSTGGGSSSHFLSGAQQHQAQQHSQRSLDDESKLSRDDLVVHQMRCLEALGRWSELEFVGRNALNTAASGGGAEDAWRSAITITASTSSSRGHHPSGGLPQSSGSYSAGTAGGGGHLNLALSEADKRQRIAQMAARGSWAIGDFDLMNKYVQQVNQNSQEGSFLRAILAIKNNDFKEAFNYVYKVRDMFDSELTSLASESYERAYGATILVQLLTELEEAIEYKMIPERQARISVLWSRRLQGCRQNIGQWQKILQVRSIVMSEDELRPLWIKYSALCRRQGKLSMARGVLQSLLDVPTDTLLANISLPAIALEEPSPSPQLAFAVCKQLWIEGRRRPAFTNLESLTVALHRLMDRRHAEQQQQRGMMVTGGSATAIGGKLEADARIIAKCYLKLGEWHSQLVQQSTLLTGGGSGGGSLATSIAARRGSVSVPVGVSTAAVTSVAAGQHPLQQQQQQQFYQRQMSNYVAIPQQQIPAQRSVYQYGPLSPAIGVANGFATIEQSTKLILQYYINATNFNPSWYKAWHRLATTYYNLVMTDRQINNRFGGVCGIEQPPPRSSPLLPTAVAVAVSNTTPVPVATGTAAAGGVPAGAHQIIQQHQYHHHHHHVAPHQYPPQLYPSLQQHQDATATTTLLTAAQQQLVYQVAAAQEAQVQAQQVAVQFGCGNSGLLVGIHQPPSHQQPQLAGGYALPPMGVPPDGGGVLLNLPPLGAPPPPMTDPTVAAALMGGGEAADNAAVLVAAAATEQEIRQRQQQQRYELDEALNQATAAVVNSGVAPHQQSGVLTTARTTTITSSNSPQSPLKAQQHQQHLMSMYAAHAVRCFFKAIQLAEGSRLDDTLRLLMLWFDYGERLEVFEVLRDSLKLVPLESWLEVMPQLIARLDSQQNTGLLVKQLIIDISKVHPQALIYALTAAAKSRNAQRSKVAKEVLDIMCDHRPVLVEQAQLLNSELIRCAILWHELWHEALEDASRYYFQEKNTEEMMNILRPLHAKIEQGHTTLKEQSFTQTYYKELKDAYEHCEAYHLTGNQKEMQAAWDLYFIVFKRMTSQLRQMTALDLNYISPRLVKANNMEISVPGTYDPQSPLITIASINHHLQVIMSKQRPRKIYMRGSNGKEYAFLLKGHEDPRQDERVMQLFGLINSLILRESDTCRRNISIQRYSIITLSQSSGLIGWLPNCDTLHALIKDYREKKKIVLSEEHTRMQKLVVDIDKVTLMQKVEVFEETLCTTSGDDLRQALWMKSPNSEVWFDRRTNYTRSMACMSMVGYILGLGDRHPSNLMLDRLSGKIVHIDFGDCFEVAMKREKYPEKIPFRLTRMLVRAMEVTGIEGNYRLTCERVLRLLRNSNDSILAVLEAFVYDPVLNWRLAEGPVKRQTNEPVGLVGRCDSNRRGDCEAINRVKAKLCGRDFNQYQEISVSEQVNRLIEQATLNDNLCQCYIGWCPFW